jgi:hypothetical protein
MEQTNLAGKNFQTTDPQAFQPVENRPSPGINHTLKTYRLLYLQARDQFKRAERDLGETAAFVAAALTTATAIQAVITVANDKLQLGKEVLQEGFYIYIAVFALIFICGALRCGIAIKRRAKAEKEIDKARQGIFQYSPPDQWPKFEE